MSEDHLRLSDAERDLASTELAEHYAAGRLTAEEHAERLDRLWAARTRGQLHPLFGDLPTSRTSPSATRHTSRTATRTVGPRWARGLPTPLLVLLVVLAGAAVLTHLPLVLVGLGVWFLLVRRGCLARPRWQRWS